MSNKLPEITNLDDHRKKKEEQDSPLNGYCTIQITKRGPTFMLFEDRTLMVVDFSWSDLADYVRANGKTANGINAAEVIDAFKPAAEQLMDDEDPEK